jgi:CRISPR-associated protein Csx3
MSSSDIYLSIENCQTSEGLKYQLLEIDLVGSDRIIEPQDLAGLELPAGIDPHLGVVISGRAPIWLYAYLVHELHPTRWVACFDPRLGGVVVATHCKEVKIGQIVAIEG